MNIGDIVQINSDCPGGHMTGTLAIILRMEPECATLYVPWVDGSMRFAYLNYDQFHITGGHAVMMPKGWEKYERKADVSGVN